MNRRVSVLYPNHEIAIPCVFITSTSRQVDISAGVDFRFLGPLAQVLRPTACSVGILCLNFSQVDGTTKALILAHEWILRTQAQTS